ncbi:MAG: dihydrofolate reductase [Sandaracinaceae bacterium]|nr:dihydrofolate reductase [Sandaracinaceae bacterium]
MRVSLIAALARDGGIGKDGGLLFRLRSDLEQFKRRTLGAPVIMGRKTWESLPRRPLPGRLNIVLSRRPGSRAEGAEIAPDLEAALAIARASGATEAFVIGGEAVYAAALPLADRLVLTHVDAVLAADAFFPPLDLAAWRVVEEEAYAASARDEHPFRVRVYERAG